MARGPHRRCRHFLLRAWWLAWGLVAPAWLGVDLAPAQAAEQAEAFIAGLSERGMNDMVLEYLDRMASSRLADEQFRQQIPYHRGMALLEQSQRAGSADRRSAFLSEARQILDEFAEANPNRVEAAEARGQLGSVLLEQARRNVAQANRLADDDAQRAPLASEARELIEQAHAEFATAETFYSDELAKIPKTLDPRQEGDLIERRQEYRGRLAQARLLVSQSDYEKAQTYPEDAPEFRQLNESAAAALGELFEKYSRWLVGFYANLYEGRCYQALGEYKQALGCYDNIVAQPDQDPAFRRLITTGYRYQTECLIAQQQFDAAIANCEAWLQKARSVERNEPEWLALRYQLAAAYRAKAESLDEKNAQYRNLIGEARDAYRVVSRIPGEFQQPARSALSQLGGGRSPGDELRTFDAAYDAGRAELDELNSITDELETARQQNAAGQVSDLQSQATAARATALDRFDLALKLADDEIEIAKLNEVRYFTCWLYYQQEDYFRAAILGEFIARRYPNHVAAKAAAKLAMASYERLYNQAMSAGQGHEDTEFEASRLAAMAEFITRRWPDSDDAEAALSVLLNFSLRHDRLDEARQILAELSPDRRARMQLKLGNALWTKSVEFSRQAATDQQRRTAATLRSEALELLRGGVDAANESGQVTGTTAVSALYLAQALVGDGQYDEAIDLLEDNQIGPLTLVQSGHTAAAGDEFAAGAFKTALQAYVSVIPPQGDKAVEIMAQLEQAVGQDVEATERLTKIYIGLGGQLQRQIEQLKADNRDREAERVSKAFAEFLSRVADRQESANWQARSWIAQTFFSMGEGLGHDSDRGREFFAKARDAYQQMIDRVEQDPGFAPSPLALLAAKKQLGLALQKSGDFGQALNTYSEILAEKVTRLDVQKAAAYACQAWGEEGDPKWLERAIAGGLRQRSDGKNRIWGWARIANVVSRYKEDNPQHRDTFFEAWFNTARCRYLIGIKSDDSQRELHLERAKTTIRSIVQQYPDLGSHWRERYDQLARQIQKAQGLTPTGLAEFSS